MREQPEYKSIATLIMELLELLSAYVRQELRAAVDSGLVRPLRNVGRWLALVTVASTLFALSCIFLAVGAFQLLARLVGAPWIAYLIVGGVLFIGGIMVMVPLFTKGETEDGDERS